MNPTLTVQALSSADGNPARVGGRIWLTIGDEHFPEARWTDSPMSVLGSFRTALDAVSSGESEADFCFFDGPYFVKLIRGDADADAVFMAAVCDRQGLIDGTGDGVVLAAADSTLTHLESVLASAAATVREWADSCGFPSVAAMANRIAAMREVNE